MDSSLEEVVLSDDRVEEGLHVDSTVLVAVELQESWGAEEVSKLQGELWGNGKEGVVVQALLVIMGRWEVLAEELVKLFEIYISNYLPSLSNTSEVLCLRKRFLASCRTLALIGFSVCCDFWKNLGTFLKLGSDYSSFFLASSM